MLIGGRILTAETPGEDEMIAGPSTSKATVETTPKLDHKYFDQERCYAPSKKIEKTRIELCRTMLPVLESPMSPPDHGRGPSQDPLLVRPVTSDFHASYHIQNSRPYDNLSRQSCTSCMVCGKAVDEIKEERIIWYMERSTPRDEPEFITKLKREAGSLLFFAPAVSQAIACGGNSYTTTTSGQDITPGLLPIY